jgi:hypothetical protein
MKHRCGLSGSTNVVFIAGADLCKERERAIAEAYDHGYALLILGAFERSHATVSRTFKQIDEMN